MASVIFFRAVNVGGHQTFKPGLLALELAEFGVVNVGAAGTFVVRGAASPSKLREEIHHRLPFKPELMICPARAVAELLANKPFEDAPTGKDVTHYVSVVGKTRSAPPPCPIELPSREAWEVMIHHITGPFVICVQRPGKKKLYPNAVVEKVLDVPATTRNWNTFVKVGELLKKPAGE